MIEILVKKVLSIIELVGVVMKVEGNVLGLGLGLLLLFEFDDKVFLVDLVVLWCDLDVWFLYDIRCVRKLVVFCIFCLRCKIFSLVYVIDLWRVEYVFLRYLIIFFMDVGLLKDWVVLFELIY